MSDQTKPSVPALRAAVAINTKTDELLRRLGLNPGEMTQSNHDTTAAIIDRETGLFDAALAIGHVLRQIRDRSEVGWYLGHGTKTWARLTQAYALLFGEQIEDVQEEFAARRAADPKVIKVDVAGQAMYAACHRYGPAWETLSDYDRQEWARHERSLGEDFYGVQIEATEGGEE